MTQPSKSLQAPRGVLRSRGGCLFGLSSQLGSVPEMSLCSGPIEPWGGRGEWGALALPLPWPPEHPWWARGVLGLASPLVSVSWICLPGAEWSQVGEVTLRRDGEDIGWAFGPGWPKPASWGSGRATVV